MSLIYLKISATLTLFIVSLIFGLLPIRLRISNPCGIFPQIAEALGCGIFLGTALFHMLPEAENSLNQLANFNHYPYTYLLCFLGFISLFIVEKIFFLKTRANLQHLPYIIAIILSLHAFTEGIVLGINTDLESTFIIFFAILVHKGSESFALVASLIQSLLRINTILKVFLLFSIMTPLGILSSFAILTILNPDTLLMTQAFFNAFAAGLFLYIATRHQKDTLHYQQQYLFTKLTATLSGLSLMAVLAIWL